MKNKNISKLTILSCLMLTSTIKAQNFYTCVPDENWFENEQKKIKIREQKLAEMQQNIFKKENWTLVYNNATSGVLEPGFYYVIVGGGKGGNMQHPYSTQHICEQNAKWHNDGNGGSGEVKGKFILLKQRTSFSASIGRDGRNEKQHYCCHTADSGSSSSFTINNETTTSRGGGGASSQENCYSKTCDYKSDGYQRYYDIEYCRYTSGQSYDSYNIFLNFGCSACVRVYKVKLELPEDIIKILLNRNP